MLNIVSDNRSIPCLSYLELQLMNIKRYSNQQLKKPKEKEKEEKLKSHFINN